ncbi:MAG: cyclic nucleotide-binding domain-containing protein [Polyangiales bacterium]
MSERTDRPTDAEYGSEPSAAPNATTEEPTITVRSSTTDPPTLRLGTGSPEDALPAWRARYEDLGELARGGMSSIRLVFDRIVRRRVAMKVHDRERDPSGLTTFIEEARITGQLDHPNVVPVHDVQHDENGQPTRFTMKLVEGETLADILERRGPQPLHGVEAERLLGILLKVSDAIAFAHSRGVIHCDLKPSNIMVGSHGQVYVTDWGVALRRAPTTPELSEHDRPTRPFGGGTLCGTPAYMAPEQAWGRREEVDERTDVYGLGGILYAMLTLCPPHDGGSSDADLDLAKRGFVRRPQDVVRDRPLPAGLCRIAMKALLADPGQRHPSVEAFKLELEQLMRGGGWFETVRLPQGALVVREGDLPDAAYILVEGECELFRNIQGKRRFIRTLSTGEVFGETSIFGSSTRTASVAAATDVTLVRVTREALERELERTEWLKAFVEALAGRFIELDLKLRELEGPEPR